MKNWNVMKLCERQLRDINPQDVLNDGLYRKCNTYKGGGGYNKFPEIYNRRQQLIGEPTIEGVNDQFVVQLKGCPLSCPYCYVTPDGVSLEECVEVSTRQLVSDFKASGLSVFHLMGGAPALYIEDWVELLWELPSYAVFHSDLLLIEKPYSKELLYDIHEAFHSSLYAVSIKGATPEEFKRNTGCKLNQKLFWENLDALVSTAFPFYFTYTGMTEESIKRFQEQLQWCYGLTVGRTIAQDSFSIDIVEFEAIKEVRTWL